MSTSSSGFRKLLRFLAVAGAVFATLLGAVGCGVYRSVTLRGNALPLKEVFVSWTRLSPATTKLELAAGPGVLCAARMVLSQINDVPPEARDALRCVRSGSVGIYEYDGRPAAARGTLVAEADAAMHRRGWRRVVGVLDGKSTVLIYAPPLTAEIDVIDVCVAVVDECTCVLVAAELRTEGLQTLVEQQLLRVPRVI